MTLLTTCVQDYKTHFLVKLEDTKTKTDRSFIIVPGKLANVNLLELVRRYIALRPSKTPHKRFFINYVREKCTVQPVGIHKVGGVPAVVAKYLGLENSSSYTGHCFRRTSASLLANAGASMEGIKRHGGWRSSSVAEGYIEDSESTKITTANKILGEISHEERLTGNNIAVEDQQHARSSAVAERKEVDGMSICGNNNCVINITNYYNNNK